MLPIVYGLFRSPRNQLVGLLTDLLFEVDWWPAVLDLGLHGALGRRPLNSLDGRKSEGGGNPAVFAVQTETVNKVRGV